MQELKTFEDFKDLIQNKRTFLLFSHAKACGVCDVFAPKVEALAEAYGLPLYGALIEDLPELRGQLGFFAVPVLSVYYQGREYHKQARFLNLEEAEGRIQEIAGFTEAKPSSEEQV